MAHYEKYLKKKYNHITVIAFSGWRDSKQFWKCICDCGKELFLDAEQLQRGKPKSCGCAIDPTSETFKKNALNRILSQIEKTQDCWIWKGLVRKEKSFYPYCNFNHIQYHPVKFFKMLINDELPKNWAYKKKCYTKNCVNPDHYEKFSISRIRYTKKENL